MRLVDYGELVRHDVHPLSSSLELVVCSLLLLSLSSSSSSMLAQASSQTQSLQMGTANTTYAPLSRGDGRNRVESAWREHTVHRRSEPGSKYQAERPREVIRVLTVDDHPLLRDGIAALIGSEEDMELIGEASNGREGARAVPNIIDRTLP